VLSTATSRPRWVASHVLIAALGSLWLLLVAGTCAGAAAASTSEAGFRPVVGAALATWPAVLVCVGLTLALFGVLPRLSLLAWGLLAVFLLIGEFGPLLKLPDWALGLSPFDHLGNLPGGDADVAGLVGLLVVTLAAVAVGTSAFRRRDVAT
jgi:ABC-2 type transport system permease protein